MLKFYFNTVFVFFIFLFSNSPSFGQIVNNQNASMNSNLAIPTCNSITPPYLQTFDNSFFYDSTDPMSLDSCWFQSDINLIDSIGNTYLSTSFNEHKAWFKNGFGNLTDSGAITYRPVSGVSNSQLLITPSINLGTVTDTFTLEFDLTFTDTASNSATSFGSGIFCTQSFKVLYSLDDGLTWSFTTGFDELIFDINNIPDFPTQHYSLLLQDPTDYSILSGNVRLGFYFSEISNIFPCNDIFDIHLDNFEISDDVEYNNTADIYPSLSALPIAVNGTQTYKALDQLCIGQDLSAALLFSIGNNGPYPCLASESYIFNSVGDTLVYIPGGYTGVAAGNTFFENVENLCPGILDSAYTCDLKLVMYSTNPPEEDASNDTIDFQIVSHDSPSSLEINSDTTICPGSPVILNGVSTSTVNWEDGFGNSYNNGEEVAPSVTTTYFAKSGTGLCAIEEQFKVTIMEDTLNITMNGNTLNATIGFDSYEWTHNGSVVGNTSSINITTNGVYIVTGTKLGCDFKEEIDVNNISVQDYETLPESIYPNPFDKAINIPIEFECADIYNVRGQIVLSTSENLINVSDLPSGLYKILVHTMDKTYQQKLIKQ